ncbi:hypothetical protein BD324DRAFT_616024 [Kockovaella imperatae]|uniref:chitin deacetylase n=1 Tax=Kockovaella imperatae TaxID=4999 RepID=A0A1Y1UPW1_9TREE|nr:hypothetical protein BD324DRAFT_616024 [Kockovaella imperatae]ORX40039.1 hypothetical protein BD324DRAFT_616024 [Kockovaella imperatae]
MIYPLALAAAVLSSSSLAHPPSPRIVQGDWFQPRDSPVHELFKRDPPNPNDPNFQNSYPPGWATPPVSSLPQSWLNKLASIQLPNVSVSNPNNGYPTYADGESPSDSTICSFTYQCTTSTDLVNPPDGVIAISFDDGPTDESPTLYAYLQENNIASHVTHFMIGSNILSNPLTMQSAFNMGGHIAVHTWTHLYMTTLSNEALLAEFGWTMQIISDLTGGRIPMYWRPPYGDVDNRVRAIASGVFGLKTVPWNQDSGDWAIGHDPAYTNSSVQAQMEQWITGSKSPGLLILEHETNPNTVANFEYSYPLMKSNDWKVENVAEAFGFDWYQNSANNNGSAAAMSVAGGSVSGASATSSSTSSSSAASSTSASAASTTSDSGPSISAAAAGAGGANGSASKSSGASASVGTESAAKTSGAAMRGVAPFSYSQAGAVASMVIVSLGTIVSML